MIAAVRLHHRQPGWFAIVHGSTDDSEGPWRVTWFDALGPSGHTCRNTFVEALIAAVRDGYKFVIDDSDIRHQ